MKNKNNSILIIASIIILGGLIAYGSIQMKQQAMPTSDDIAAETIETNTVTYYCDDNKSIETTYYLPGDEQVTVVLSDGRSMTLPHVISGSGARYATSDESVVFWNKGTTAFLTEGDDTTYANCDQHNTDDQSATQTMPPAGSSLHVEIQDQPTICTMEAKQCPDGSYVGRSGPSCEFSACPGN